MAGGSHASLPSGESSPSSASKDIRNSFKRPSYATVGAHRQGIRAFQTERARFDVAPPLRFRRVLIGRRARRCSAPIMRAPPGHVEPPAPGPGHVEPPHDAEECERALGPMASALHANNRLYAFMADPEQARGRARSIGRHALRVAGSPARSLRSRDACPGRGLGGPDPYNNHPSGDVMPSHEDLRLTRQLAEAGKLLDTSSSATATRSIRPSAMGAF
jgi:hypothetical protein